MLTLPSISFGGASGGGGSLTLLAYADFLVEANCQVGGVSKTWAELIDAPSTITSHGCEPGSTHVGLLSALTDTFIGQPPRCIVMQAYNKAGGSNNIIFQRSSGSANDMEIYFQDQGYPRIGDILDTTGPDTLHLGTVQIADGATVKGAVTWDTTSYYGSMGGSAVQVGALGGTVYPSGGAEFYGNYWAVQTFAVYDAVDPSLLPSLST